MNAQSTRAANARAHTTPLGTGELLKLGAASSLVDRLMRAAFDVPREPRSDAYWLGACELLNCQAHGLKIFCPYTPGTAEADAYFAGVDEGRAIWRRHEEARASNFESQVPQ